MHTTSAKIIAALPEQKPNFFENGKTVPYLYTAENFADWFAKIKADRNLIHSFDAKDNLPLSVAATLCSAEQVQQLLNLGANVFTVDKTGKSALHFALARNEKDLEKKKILEILALAIRNAIAHAHTIKDYSAINEEVIKLYNQHYWYIEMHSQGDR